MPGTTAGAIDAFERRFTLAHGAHFLIAPGGRKAWPISEAEGIAFRERYRRVMGRARWFRRFGLLGFIPLMILNASLMPAQHGALRTTFESVQLFLLLLPLIGLIQHPIVSDITKLRITKGLARRVTTRDEAAITPVTTPLGRFARALLSAAFVIEICLAVGHSLGPQEELGAYLRVLYGMPGGNEDWLAWFTGSLGRMMGPVALLGGLLMMIDRRRRAAAAARAPTPAPAETPAAPIGGAPAITTPARAT